MLKKVNLGIMENMKKDFLDLTDVTKREIEEILALAKEVKANPEKYVKALEGKTLLMIFAKPSLRTRVSFEVAMTQLGGHAIYYDVSTSPWGKKESIADTAKTVSRYVDIMMARLFAHKDIEELACNSSIPVINGLTDFAHPCQILSDFLTIQEKKGKLSGLKLAYFGDGNNNITHSLLLGGSIVGMDIFVACPEQSQPQAEVLEKAKAIAQETSSKIVLINDAEMVAKEADVVYTDSWMSYHIPEADKQKRIEIFAPYQVNEHLMSLAQKDAVFMHCLPAQRGMEMTAGVIDGKQSIVFDQASNRLYLQKALMLKLL